jgi:hypothetical protein
VTPEARAPPDPWAGWRRKGIALEKIAKRHGWYQPESGGTAAVLPWVERRAAALVRNLRCALHELDQDEERAVLRAVVDLLTARTRRRSLARRRRVA